NVVNKEQLGKDETAADSDKLGGKGATEYSTKIWVENKGYLVEDDLPDPIDISGKEDTSNKATNLDNPNNTKYPTTKAVSDAIPTKTSDLINNSNYITKSDIPETEINTDDSLYFDDNTRVLRSNVASTTQYFTYTSGSQSFSLTDTPTNVVFVSVNGQILKVNDQYSIEVSGKTLNITDELEPGD